MPVIDAALLALRSGEETLCGSPVNPVACGSFHSPFWESSQLPQATLSIEGALGGVGASGCQKSK